MISENQTVWNRKPQAGEQLVSTTITPIVIAPTTKQDCIDEILHYSKLYAKYTRFERFFRGKDTIKDIKYWAEALIKIEKEQQ